MFTVLIQQRQITIDKYFKLYIVFIVFFIVGDMSAGLLEPSFRRLMGFYFVSFVAYQATKVLIAKFDGQKWLAGTLLIIGIVDALVTVGYMYGLPISPVIRSFLYIDVQDELIEELMSRNLDSLDGYAVPGLLERVTNGYFLCIMSVISFSVICRKVNFLNYLCWLVILFGLFCVQERTAFFVGTFFSVLIIFRNNLRQSTSLGKRLLFIFVVFVIIIYALPLLIDTLVTEKSRYSMDASLSRERGKIIEMAIPYIFNNPFGGWDYYIRQGYPYPHNLVINALLFGGWIGGIVIIYLILKQSYEILLSAYKKNYWISYSAYIWGIAYICYTLNSITHNLSIVYGDPTIWILWGAFISNKYLFWNEKKKQG